MLEIKHLSKTYPGGKQAVRDLSLTIEPGDIYGFIGHNGAGKTTAIKCAVGILDFEQGEILIDGHSVREEPLACKQITAYVPDNPDLYQFLSGIAYLNFICDIFGVDGAARTARIGALAGQLELTPALGDQIASYSHGMKQKLALIAALVHEPKLIVLDEPFVGLDPQATATLKALMRQKCAAGCAFFFSTHVLDVAEKLCNKVAIIRDGALVTAGETRTLTGGQSLEQTFLEVVNVQANP